MENQKKLDKASLQNRI